MSPIPILVLRLLPCTTIFPRTYRIHTSNLLHTAQEIAPKYFETRFLRVFVENVPWLVEKLSIKVLPCVIVFLDGVAKDRSVILVDPPVDSRNDSLCAD